MGKPMSQAFSMQLRSGIYFLKTLTWEEHWEFRIRLGILIKILNEIKVEIEKGLEQGEGLGVEAD